MIAELREKETIFFSHLMQHLIRKESLKRCAILSHVALLFIPQFCPLCMSPQHVNLDFPLLKHGILLPMICHTIPVWCLVLY